MNKYSLALKVQEELSIPYTEAYNLTTVFLKAMKQGLKDDGVLRFVDFLTITVVPQAPKKVRDIRRGQSMDLKERQRLRVTPGKTLKADLNNNALSVPGHERSQ